MTQEVRDQALDETLGVLQWRSGQSVRSLQPLYTLNQVEFMRLKGAPLRTETLSLNLLFAWIAYLLTLLPREIDHLQASTKEGPSPSEWLIVWVGMAVVVGIWLVGFFLEDPRKITFNKIEKFFAAHEAADSQFPTGGFK